MYNCEYCKNVCTDKERILTHEIANHGMCELRSTHIHVTQLGSACPDAESSRGDWLREGS